MASDENWRMPLAVLAVREQPEPLPDLPIAYVPRIPEGRTYRDVLERGVGWGRR
jgi:hypothetical protein